METLVEELWRESGDLDTMKQVSSWPHGWQGGWWVGEGDAKGRQKWLPGG